MERVDRRWGVGGMEGPGRTGMGRDAGECGKAAGEERAHQRGWLRVQRRLKSYVVRAARCSLHAGLFWRRTDAWPARVRIRLGSRDFSAMPPARIRRTRSACACAHARVSHLSCSGSCFGCTRKAFPFFFSFSSLFVQTADAVQILLSLNGQ